MWCETRPCSIPQIDEILFLFVSVGGDDRDDGRWLRLDHAFGFVVQLAAGAARPGAHQPAATDRRATSFGAAAAVGQTTRLAVIAPLSITCPHCGEEFQISFDADEGSAEFVVDCEVCCRPFEVVAECEPGEVLSWEVVPA